MEKETIKKGKVISIRGREIHVMYQNNISICRIKNSLFRTITNQKNIITIGDMVLFNDSFQIISIEDRNTLLERQDPLNKRKKQLIAANIDRAYITFSMVSPSIDVAMLDRYIIAAKKGGIEPAIILNKIDLLEDEKQLEAIVKTYQDLKIPIYPISCADKEGFDSLIHSLENITSIFCGPSGVGKTSIINYITGKNLEVGKISEKIQKGKHTTTFSSLFPLNETTFIVDSPGIASFSLFDFSLESLLDFYQDFYKPLGHCKYNNCTHTHEPGCKVKEANEKNLLAPLRFQSYQTILQDFKK